MRRETIGPRDDLVVGGRVIGTHHGQLYRGWVGTIHWRSNMVSIIDEQRAVVARLHKSRCAPERPAIGDALYVPGDRIMVAPQGWKKRYRFQGYVSAYNADHTVMVMRDTNYDFALQTPEGLYPVAFLAPCPATFDDPAPVPEIKFSIRKDGEGWVVATLQNGWRNEHQAATVGEVYCLLNELREVGEHLCPTCGGPLWQVNGRIVCSRYWEHYPQPAGIVKACTHRERGFEATCTLPAIKQNRTYNGFKFPTPPEVREHAASWRHFNAVAKLLMETVESTTPDGRRLVESRWRSTDAVDCDRLLTGTGKRYQRKRLTRVTVRVEAPTPAASRHAYPDPLNAMYQEYRQMMDDAKLPARGYHEWVTAYNEHRRR